MRKNWLQIVTFGSCAALRVVTVVQGRELNVLSKSLDMKLSKSESHLDRAISNVDDQVALRLEGAFGPSEDFEARPLMDKENQTLEGRDIPELSWD